MISSDIINCKNKPYSTSDHPLFEKKVICRGEGLKLYYITYNYQGPRNNVEEANIEITLKAGTGSAFEARISGKIYYI